MNVRADCNLVSVVERLLKQRFEQRPYRRAIVQPGGGRGVMTDHVMTTLGVGVTALDPSRDDFRTWLCSVTIVPPHDRPREGLEAALEVIDCMHGGDGFGDCDNDGQEDDRSAPGPMIVIDAIFQEARWEREEADGEGVLTVFFEVSTVNDDMVQGDNAAHNEPCRRPFY